MKLSKKYQDNLFDNDKQINTQIKKKIKTNKRKISEIKEENNLNIKEENNNNNNIKVEDVENIPNKKKKIKKEVKENLEIKKNIDFEKIENSFSLDYFLTSLEKKKFKKILFIIGAGASVAAGIPDFRSPSSGFYAQLREAKVEEAEEIFNLDYFKENPYPFFTIAGDFLMKVSGRGNNEDQITQPPITPTPCHKFMMKIYENKQLSKILTQNIDSLELEAGLPSSTVVQIHGHMKTASCINCKQLFDLEEFWNCVKMKKIWYCKPCLDNSGMSFDQEEEKKEDNSNFRRSIRNKNNSLEKQREFLKTSSISTPILTSENYEQEDSKKKFEKKIKKQLTISSPNDCLIKPDILFFNEKMPRRTTSELSSALSRCDLVIIIGTSLLVKPISQVISTCPPHLPIVILDRCLPKLFRGELQNHQWLFLQGDIQETVQKIAESCNWQLS